MSKKELSQSDKDLAEELANGIYIGDSPIVSLLINTLVFSFVFLLIDLQFSLSNMGSTFLYLFLVTTILLQVKDDYIINQSNADYLKELYTILILNDIKPIYFKKLTRESTITSIIENLHYRNISYET